MLEKNESVQVPSRFALCYKSDCRRAGECLRYQVAGCVSGERSVVCVVNLFRRRMRAIQGLPCTQICIRHDGRLGPLALPGGKGRETLYAKPFWKNSFLSFDAEATLFQAGRPSVCGRRVPEIRHCKRTCFRQLPARL